MKIKKRVTIVLLIINLLLFLLFLTLLNQNDLLALLFRVLSHYLPQRKFYASLYTKQNNINHLFNMLKKDIDKKGIFLNLCFSLSKSIEPGEGNDNNLYLLNILANEPIEELKKNLDECQDDINIKQNLITEAEFDIFFSDIFEEWNDLIQELYNYSKQYQNQIQAQESLPEELSNKINYIRLFIRSVLPGDAFSNFMFNFTSYCNLKEKNIFNDNSDDEDENFNLGVQAYNPEIFKKCLRL